LSFAQQILWKTFVWRLHDLLEDNGRFLKALFVIGKSVEGCDWD
jgi:hypothetical protein